MRKDMQPKRKKVRTTFLIIVSLLASVVDLSAQSVDVGTPTADSDTLFRRCITVVDVETMVAAPVVEIVAPAVLQVNKPVVRNTNGANRDERRRCN